MYGNSFIENIQVFDWIKRRINFFKFKNVSKYAAVPAIFVAVYCLAKYFIR
jgi:hypothetical protein